MRSRDLDPTSWPVLPRPEVSDAVVAALLKVPPRSHLLRGASGIGKSTIAANVAARLAENGRRVVPIVALAELRDIPLAALAPVLSARAVTGENLDERVHTLVRLLGGGAGDYVIVVDDAPLLDDLSASVVYQLVRVFGLPVLLTARDEHTIGGPIGRLLHENLVTVIDVDPLDVQQITRLVESHLHEPVRPESVNALLASSEGNPLLLRELVFAEQRAGRVRHGKFGLELETGELPAHMLDTVRDRIEALSPADLRLAELLALSQPWPETVSRAADTGSLTRLIRSGMVAHDESSGRRQTRLAHPLFAEALRAGLDDSERVQALHEAANMLMLAGGESERFTAICLTIDLPNTSGAGLEWAAERAITLGDPSMARRLATAAARHERRFPSQLIVATASSALGDIEEAEAAFVIADELALEGPDRALLALRWGQHLAYRQRSPAEAVARAMIALEHLEPVDASILLPEVAKWRLMAGDTTALDETASLTSGVDPLGTLAAGLGQAMFSTMLGDSAAARVAISDVRPHLDSLRAQLPHAESLLDLSEFLIAIADGKTHDAQLFAEDRRVQGSAEAAGVWSYTLAFIHMHAGRHDLAMPLAELAIRQLEWRDFTGLLGPAIALGAAVFALNGERLRAQCLRERLDAVAEQDIKVALHLAEYGVWTASTPEGRREAIHELVQVVSTALDQAHHVLAALSATIAMRAGGSAEVVELLERAALGSPSVLVGTVAGVARASVTCDAETIIAHVPRLRAAGLISVAHRVASDIRAFPRAPELVRRQAIALVAELEPMTVPAPQSFTKEIQIYGASITEREWKVAIAAARRERSREIAEGLGISVRTVDNHLASVYRKLGISGRTQLVSLVKTLEEAASASIESAITRNPGVNGETE